MILVCPECTTNYELPVELPEAGAKVRCVSCSHVWHASGDDLLDVSGNNDDDVPLDPPVDVDEGQGELDQVGGDAIDAVSPLDDDLVDDIEFTDVSEEPPAEETDDNSQGDIDDMFSAMEADGASSSEDFGAISPLDNDSLDDVVFEEEAVGDGVEAVSPFDDDPVDDIAFDETEGDENDQDGIDSLFDEPEPEGEENDQDGIDSLFDEPEPDPESGSDENDQGGIDSLFDEPEEETAPEEVEALEPETPEREPMDVEAAVEQLADALDFVPTIVPENAVRKTVIGWSIYGAALIFMLGVLVFARTSVVRNFPAMASTYSMIGLPVNVRQLMFTSLQQKWIVEEDQLRLKVEGEILNMTNEFRALPKVVFGAHTVENQEIYRWVTSVRDKPLLPGEKAVFSVVVPPPPQRAHHMVVRFVK